MIRHPSKFITLVLSLFMFAGACIGASPPKAIAAEENATRSSGIVSVDRTTFFNEGKYINLEDFENPIGKADFTVSGGKMIDLAPSGSKYDDSKERSPYKAVQIPYENIRGRTSGISGFGFVCDGMAASANGASVSITYDYVGEMKDIADPASSTPVSIKATYTIRDGKTVAEEGDYQAQYNGHPVVQIPPCFSYGVFFCGTNILDTRYEFFNADTGAPIQLGRIYVTATSLNRGEGFAVPSAQVKNCYVSNEAPSASTIYNCNGLKTPYQVVPGSFLYDKSAELGGGYTTFIGCPDVYDSSGNKNEFVDIIGDETFYWRSVCFSLDCGTTHMVEAKAYAVKTANWSGTSGVPGDQMAMNGSMWFATNFMTLTAARPGAPTKTVDKTSGAHLGDLLTYRISQQVNDLGSDSFIRYESLILSDRLSDSLTYRSARLIGPEGNELSGAGSVNYDEASRSVSFEFSERYLENDMAMEGETYTLEIVAEVTDYPDDGTLTITNSAMASINSLEQRTEKTETDLVSPELNIEKHGDGNLATAVNDFEFQPGDEITYHVALDQTRDKTRAKSVVVSDDLPEGLQLVAGSLRVLGAEGAQITEDDSGWSIRFEQLDAGNTVAITYRAVATAEGNGREVINTALAWAKNISHDITGNEFSPARDDAEIFVNEPALHVTESVAPSPTTGDTYEHRVGETMVYTITLENTAAGTFAKNVTLSLLHLPKGFALADTADSVSFDGLACAGSPTQILYPVHRDDNAHGELETRDLIGKTDKAKDGSGASLSLNYLPAHTPVTLSLAFTATEEVNGMEITCNAVASAENATDPASSDPAITVWINSPRLVVTKQTPPLAYQANDIVTYRIDVANDARGTVARNLVIEDSFETPGMELLRNSFVVSDASGSIITDRFTIEQNIKEQTWKLITGAPLVHPERYRIGSNAHGGTVFEGAGYNPLGFDRETAYHIEYQAQITDEALAAKAVTNTVTVSSDEDLPASDKETISVEGPALDIRKTADIGSYSVGQTAEYSVSVTNLRTGTTAHGVTIDDDYAITASGTVAIDPDSISVLDERMKPLTAWDVTWKDDDAGNHRGFHIDTHADLANAGKITVAYKAALLATTPTHALVNTARAQADDAPTVKTSCSITCGEANEDILSFKKASDEDGYRVGDIAAYTLTLANTDKTVAAHNPVISDTLESTDNADIVPGSVEIADETGAAIASANIVYTLNEEGATAGFTVTTQEDLLPSKTWTITYRVRISDDAVPGNTIENTAKARCNNGHEVEAEHSVSVTEEPPTDAVPVIGYKTTAYVTAEAPSGATVQPGEELLYRITVRNTGATPAATVRVRDYIPAGTGYLFDSASDNGVYVRSSKSHAAYVEWTLNDLVPEEDRTVSFKVQVAEEGPHHIVNTARYCATTEHQEAGDVTLPDPERVTAQTIHTVAPEEPVGDIINVVMSSSPSAGATLSPGDTVTYTLIATNHGGSTAEDVLVKDAVPSSFSYVAGSVSNGGSFDESADRMRWKISRLEPGESAEMSFRTMVGTEFSPGSLENQASFTAAADEEDEGAAILENTSNIVEHALPDAGPNALAPKTGDSSSLVGIGLVVLLGASTCALIALCLSKAKRKSQGGKVAPQTQTPKTRPKPRRRSHKNYVAWKR